MAPHRATVHALIIPTQGVAHKSLLFLLQPINTSCCSCTQWNPPSQFPPECDVYSLYSEIGGGMKKPQTQDRTEKWR